MNKSVYEPIAEDFIAMMEEQPGGFSVMLAFNLINRSREMPTATKPDQLFFEVLEDWVGKNFFKLTSFHLSRYMQPREIPMIVEALKPLCSRAFPYLNATLAIDRDYLFPAFAYVEVRGTIYFEEAPSVTFIHFLNTMERLKAIKSSVYQRNVPHVAEVHALNRAASIMPREFHKGVSGRLQPGQTYDAMKEARRHALRDKMGIHTQDDLLKNVGFA